MELYVIRHAQSSNNALYAATGSSDGRASDPSLTDVGHLQASALAKFLASRPPDAQNERFAQRHNRGGFGLTHLYTSLMLRAVETSEYVADAIGLPPVAWPDLHERGGLYHFDEAGEPVVIAGPGRAYFAVQHPRLALPEQMDEAGWWNRTREDVNEALARARDVWARLREQHLARHDRVAIVTHAGFFQSLLATLVQTEFALSADEYVLGGVWFGISNASLSRIDFEEDFTAIRYLNRVDFLPSELLTG